jgi:DNA sulfur modification protein DndD
VRSIRINPARFQVSIQDQHGRVDAKSELSAGEKQIYAISMLWALARISGRPLPMIIDTPLARSDRDHRSLLGHQYFPNASLRGYFPGESRPSSRQSTTDFFKCAKYGSYI